MDKFEIDLGYAVKGRDTEKGKTVIYQNRGHYWSDNGINMGFGDRGKWDGIETDIADAAEALEKSKRDSSKKIANAGIYRVTAKVAFRPATQDDLATARVQSQAFRELEKQTFKDMADRDAQRFLRKAALAALDLSAEFSGAAKAGSKYVGSIALLKDGKDLVAIKSSYNPDAPLETAPLADTLVNTPESVINRDFSPDHGQMFTDRAFKAAEKAAIVNGIDNVMVGTVHLEISAKPIPKKEITRLLEAEASQARKQADRYTRIQRSLKP